MNIPEVDGAPARAPGAAVRSLVSELVLWADDGEAAVAAPVARVTPEFRWVPTVSPRYAAVREALSKHPALCDTRPAPLVLEDSLGRLHLWLARAALIEGVEAAQRVALAHRMQCLVCEDGEWARTVALGELGPLCEALARIASHSADWVVLEGGPRELCFVQVGPMRRDRSALAELVSNHYLPPALAHTAADHAQLALLGWRAPDRARCPSFHQPIALATPVDRARAAALLWRSWLAVFARRVSDERLRLRTLSS